jgi:hypothetical protein
MGELELGRVLSAAVLLLLGHGGPLGDRELQSLLQIQRQGSNSPGGFQRLALRCGEAGPPIVGQLLGFYEGPTQRAA